MKLLFVERQLRSIAYRGGHHSTVVVYSPDHPKKDRGRE